MSKDQLEDNFIAQMMEETYKFLPENDSAKDARDLLDYFRKQAASSFPSEQVNVEDSVNSWRDGEKYGLHYLSDQRCFRLDLGYHILDIPRNWFLFQKIYENLLKGDEELIILKRCQDSELFLKIVVGVGERDELVFIKGDSGEIWMYVLDVSIVNQIIDENKKGASYETPYLKTA